MKSSLMSVVDKILLRKCALIETVNDELKNIVTISLQTLCQSCRCCFLEKKPDIDLIFINDGLLVMF